MPNRFCAICGKTLTKESPHFGMCINCYLEENPLFNLPKSFSFNVCLDCGSYSKKEVWSSTSENEISTIIDEALQSYLLKPVEKKKNIKFSISLDEESYKYSSKDLLISLEAKIKGTMKSDFNFSHLYVLKLNINYLLCKNCTNLRGGTYFLSILQLRVKNENQFNLIKSRLEEINEFVERIFRKDPRHYISKIEDQKYGVDLYLSSNEIMNYIIKFLKSKYHFLLKRSKKLTGRDSQKGRNLYRLKTSIKFLPIVMNDNVLIGNQSYIVENIMKKKVILRSERNARLIKDFSYFFNNKVSKL